MSFPRSRFLNVQASTPPDRSVTKATICGIYAYDAYFLVSAQRLDCPLITLDRRMRQVAQELGIALLESEQ